MTITRYCLECDLAQAVDPDAWSRNFCRRCKGTAFSDEPRKHSGRGYEISDKDVEILRINKIDPEQDVR